MAASSPGNEGFYIDLFDNSLFDPIAAFRPSSISTVWVEHDTGGMLALKLPSKARHSLQFGFVGASLVNTGKQSGRKKTYLSVSEPSEETKKEPTNDDECVKETHSTLREVHRAIFDEQVFDLVNREAFIPSAGVNVTGIRENHLLLNIDQEASVFISLVPSSQADQTADSEGTDDENTLASSETLDGSNMEESKQLMGRKSAFPTQVSCEIFLQQIFQEHVFVKAKDRTNAAGGTQPHGQSRKDGNLLGHFCLSLAHRIFSNKVLIELENVVSKVPYVQLISYPTWHSRTSSWILSVEVPQTILHDGPQVRESDKNVKSQFRTKVVVNDDCISVEGEGAPNVVGLFKGKYENICSMNRFDCDLGDLPGILLQQVASQIIRWLHEEALMVGIKVNRDFLCLTFELETGETPSLVAHVDPQDSQGGISWWLVMTDGLTEDYKLHTDISESETRRFLGYLSLDMLYSILLDLVSLCGGGGGGGGNY